MFRNIEEVTKSESLEKNKMKSEDMQRNEHENHEHSSTIADVEQLKSIFEKYEEQKKMYDSKAGKSRNVENDSAGELHETVKKPKEALDQIPNDIVNLEESKQQATSLNNPASAYEPLKQKERLPQWKEALKNKIMEMAYKKKISYWKNVMGEKKWEDHMKKVESESLKPSANRWQELRRSRGAYGPSLGYGILPPSSGSTSSGSATTSGGSGSGAVAVFTNAKDGDCGIPFKLPSCSPSVVSGTSSTTSSYSAPAYNEH